MCQVGRCEAVADYIKERRTAQIRTQILTQTVALWSVNRQRTKPKGGDKNNNTHVIHHGIFHFCQRNNNGLLITPVCAAVFECVGFFCECGYRILNTEKIIIKELRKSTENVVLGFKSNDFDQGFKEDIYRRYSYGLKFLKNGV